MLVLTRKKNQRIVIGDDIFITVVAIGGKNVRIGIEAPDDILVMREEIRSGKQEPSEESSASSSSSSSSAACSV